LLLLPDNGVPTTAEAYPLVALGGPLNRADIIKTKD